MPHKTDVAAAVDELTDDGVMLGSVNTVLRRDGRLIGDSTDGFGFLSGLAAEGFDVVGRRCAVIGAGGAGRAAVLALGRAGVSEIVVVNRDAGRAAQAVALAAAVARHGTADEVAGAELVVNATPIGMGHDGGLAVDPSFLHAGQFVNDLIYHPSDTPLMVAARARGARTLNGLPMLVHQAARQFTLWTGVEAPLAAMLAAVEGELAARS